MIFKLTQMLEILLAVGVGAAAVATLHLLVWRIVYGAPNATAGCTEDEERAARSVDSW